MNDPVDTTPRAMWPLAQSAAARRWDVRITSAGPRRVRLTLTSLQGTLTAAWTWTRTGWRLESASVADRPDHPGAAPKRATLSDLRSIVERRTDA